MTVLTEYLTNAALLKTFAWLEAVNLFLPAPVQVQFHQSMCPGCIVTFLQRTHVILDYFPSAPDLDLFGFGKINIETFLFFFPPAKEWWAHIGYSILGLAGCSGFGRFLTLNWCIQSEHMGVLFYTTGESGVKMTTKGTCCCPHTRAWW